MKSATRKFLVECIKHYVASELNERRLREYDDVQLHSGDVVKHGSGEHVEDLKRRISELELWRSKQKRGSEVRANYSRLISKLKAELGLLLKHSQPN